MPDGQDETFDDETLTPANQGVGAKRKGIPFEDLVASFRQKANAIPKECLEPVMLWLQYKDIQRARIAAGNRLVQSWGDPEKKVAWGDGIPETLHAAMRLRGEFVRRLQLEERRVYGRLDAAMRATRWFAEVASPAAEGVGMGGGTACALLWAVGSAVRFPNFQKIARYAGLDVQNGAAPRRAKGQRQTWNPALRLALFALCDSWNKAPGCVWRGRWDAWKAAYREEHPEVIRDGGRAKYTPGHIHAMARRRVQRQFLKNLWNLWREYEGDPPPAEEAAN